jgi:hypothetical protein
LVFRTGLGNWKHSKISKQCKQSYVQDFDKPKLNQQATQALTHISSYNWCG